MGTPGGHTAPPPASWDRKLGRLTDDRDALIDEAWRLVREGLETGQMTLSNGKVSALEPKDQLRHVQWLATMGKKKPTSMPLPKDIFVAQTG